jgi:hypothetical protein
MPARTRDEIDTRYRNDIELADRWKDTDQERYFQLREQAQDRRSEGLAEVAQDAETRANTATMDAARERVRSKYPLAPASMIRGNTAEEIESSAKEAHELADKSRKDGEEAARGASRAARAGAYRAGVPGSPASQGAPNPDREAQDAALAAKGRNDALRRESGLPGDRRNIEIVTRTEEEVLQDIRLSGRAAGLSMEGFKARSEGAVTYADSAMPSKLAEEDARG